MSSQASGLVTVEPPYDHVFISLQQKIAPSAVFTYDRYWIMTGKQVSSVLGRMKEFAVIMEEKVAKAEAIIVEGSREDELNLREMRKTLDSMMRVIRCLEHPEPWQWPHDDDALAAGDLDGSDAASMPSVLMAAQAAVS